MRAFSWLCASLLAELSLATPSPIPSHAQDSPRLSLTAPGLWLRAAPSLTAPLTQPVFRGDSLDIVERTTDNAWLRVSAVQKVGWLPAAFGALDGDLSRTPAIKPLKTPPAPRARKTKFDLPSWISVPAAASARYAQFIKRGRRVAFAVAGDCNSEPDAFMRRLAYGTFDVSRYPKFAPLIQRYERSFVRHSLAASGSFSAQALFVSDWVDATRCGGVGPLDCELRESAASVLFISIGTGDTFDWRDFEPRFRRVISATLDWGAVPVLYTKSDSLESDQAGAPRDAINSVIRSVAREASLPLIDFAVAARELPNNGLRDEGNADFHLSEAGSDLRILSALRVLDALQTPVVPTRRRPRRTG